MKIVATLALALLLVLLVLGMQTRDYVACPDWDIYVVDQDGKPMPGIVMHVAAMDPKVEESYATADLTTDAQGHIFVPRRVIRASRLRAFWGALKQMPALAHGENRANGYATTPPPPGYGYANPGEPGAGAYWYDETQHATSRVVLYRCVEGVNRYGCGNNVFGGRTNPPAAPNPPTTAR